MRILIPVLLATTLAAQSAHAKPPLREVAQIDNALLDVGIADVIRKNCPSIEARRLKAINFLMGLKRQANNMGYTDAEIDAFRKDEAEKNRMRARGAAYFKARGVNQSDPQALCALGRAEIAAGSRIGSLLRAK
ncbi:MAG: DUF5333 domain-containing protein [Pseudomonadota bacterium]